MTAYLERVGLFAQMVGIVNRPACEPEKLLLDGLELCLARCVHCHGHSSR